MVLIIRQIQLLFYCILAFYFYLKTMISWMFWTTQQKFFFYFNIETSMIIFTNNLETFQQALIDSMNIFTFFAQQYCNHKMQKQEIIFPISSEQFLQKPKEKNEQSEFREHYSQLISHIQVDQIQIKQQLQGKGITYDHLNPTQDFFFQVEKIVPSFDFYRLYVSISRFKLTLNAAKYFRQNVFKTVSNDSGNYGQIYFAQLEKQELCFKSFAFNQEEVFQKVFVRAVRQLSILKICSALECAPYIKNYLGFDVIIYDDCIQFAFEKGIPLQRLDNDQILNLKEQLRLMHELKIVHCDIKPQNIIFSHHFNKAVFIDFGFSQIVKECLGYKTMSKFKGTPNYCSPQMLTIILDKQELIDLYYNDAFSLQETCKHFNYKHILAQQQYCFSELSKLEKQNYLEYSEKDKLQNIFLMFAFQYHYSCRNQVKIDYLFEKLMSLNHQNLKQILTFIKGGIDYIYFPEFITAKIKKIEKSAQYAEIKEMLQINRQLLHFQKREETENIQRKFDLRSMDLLSFSQLVNFQDSSVEYYCKIILNTSNKENQFPCYWIAMIFQCVRFDEKNLSFNQKIQIANKINPLLILHFKKQQTQFFQKFLIKGQQKQEMGSIRLLIRLIFQYCLSQKLQKWTKKHIFDVFQQIILLNDNSYEFAKLLFSFLLKYQSQFSSVEVLFELKRLIQSTWIIQSECIDKYSELKQLFQTNIYDRMNKFTELNKFSTDPEASSICALFNILNLNKVITGNISYLEEEKNLNNVKNTNIKKYLYSWMMQNRIITLNTIQKTSQMIQIAESLRKSLQIHNIPFLSRVKIFQEILIFQHNILSLKKFYKYVASVINCPQICNHFKLEAYFQQSWSEQKSLLMIDKLVNRLAYLSQQRIVNQLYRFIYNQHKIKSKQFINKAIQLYKVYKSKGYRVKPHNLQEAQSFVDIYKQALVQAYFYSLSSQTQQTFLQSKRCYQNELQAYIQGHLDQSVPKIEFYFVKMKALIFRLRYSMLTEQNCQFSLDLQEIICICQQVKLNYLMLQIIKAANHQGTVWGNQDIIIKSIRHFFNYCSLNQDYSLYLLPKNGNIFKATLHAFARQEKQTFHRLLVRLTLFLSKNPIQATKSYFINLLSSIDSFIKKDPQLCYLLHYKLYIGSEPYYRLIINPYLLIFYVYSLFNQESKFKLKLLVIFAKNCQLLSNFARKKLLEKYFIVVLSVIGQKSKRKKKFVYRQAKNYIKCKIQHKQGKKCFEISKKSRFYSKRKEKIKNFMKKID